jgi:hypothetical protein
VSFRCCCAVRCSTLQSICGRTCCCCYCFLSVVFSVFFVDTSFDTSALACPLPLSILCSLPLVHPNDVSSHTNNQPRTLSLWRCEHDIRRELYTNILVTGGGSLFPGFAERMQSEMSSLSPVSVKAKVVAPPERRHSAWLGGAILSSLAAFQQVCYITAVCHRSAVISPQSLSLSAIDVDQQGRVRRDWPADCKQEMLLNATPNLSKYIKFMFR